MMYINIKKLYSWRIRPYKIPSFFFPLLFPFFSLFPLFSSSPLFPLFPPHGVRVCPSFGCQHLRFNPREKPDTCAPSPAAKHSPSYSLPACVCVCVLNLPSCVCILCETIIYLCVYACVCVRETGPLQCSKWDVTVCV